jgi:hypothetical protein
MICTARRPSHGYGNWLKLTCVAAISAVALLPAGARQVGEQAPLNVPGLRVLEGGVSRINLDVMPKVGTRTTWNNANGAPEITMAIRPNGDRTLLFSNVEKDRYIGVNLLTDGGAAISLFSSSRQGLELVAAEDSTALLFLDKKGKVRIRLGLDKDDSPSLEFLDKDGKKTTFRATPP